MTQCPSIELITKGILAGDEYFFNLFYKNYFPKFYKYAFVLTKGNQNMIDDTLQDAMIKIIRNIKVFIDESYFWHWCVKIIKGCFIDILRKEINFKSIPMSEDQLTEFVKETELNTFCNVEIKKAIALLEPEEKKIIEYKYEENKSSEEIGLAFQMTSKAIDSKLYRIKAKLRESLRFIWNEGN